MVLTKQVNGKKVQFSEVEEAAIRAEWEENAKKKEERRMINLQEKQRQSKLMESAKAKLNAMGITEEEISILMGN